MTLLLSLLIVALEPTASIEGRFPEAAEVFHCVFGEKWDQNYDHWPDNWTRGRGPNYPRYLPIELVAEDTPVGKSCLQFSLDGGGAVAFSPPIPITSLYEYVLEGLVQTQGLKYDLAWLSLTFLDADHSELDSFASATLCDTQGWKKLRLGPVVSRNKAARFVLIGLHLEPGVRADLKGTARFTDLWLGRLPRIALTTGSDLQVFTSKNVSVHCKASGFPGDKVAVKFYLEDVEGKMLATQEERLSRDEPETGTPSSASQEPSPATGSARWKPPIPGPGFYRLYATMPGRESPHHRPALSLVVLSPQRQPEGSEFGWTIPRADSELPATLLADLLSQAGVGWVKYPVWYDEASFEEKMAALVPFVESLGGQGIELVGLLLPPETLCDELSRRRPISVAEVFSQEPKVWYPTVEQTLARMAVQVRWWQLGDDRDLSFVDMPNLAERIRQVKAELDRLGNDVNVGLGWDWAQPLPRAPEGEEPPWRFLALTASPSPTPEKLGELLDGSQQAAARRWVSLEPLPRASHTLDARVNDLIWQMITARLHHAGNTFVADPFSEHNGLMNADGTPGELFLPWRTTALALGATTFAGSILLPNESQNQIFVRQKEAVMVLWNTTPQRESLYLGQNVQQVDPWGRPLAHAASEDGIVLEAGPRPTFVLGVDPAVVRWRQEVSFSKSQLPSILGRRHENILRMKNPLDYPVTGSFRLIVPEEWRVEPRDVPFQLESGKSLEQPFQITLADNALCGPQRISVEYSLHGDSPVRFCAYQKMEVGLGDVKIDVATKLNEQDELEIEQCFTNTTDVPVSFRCYLYAPEQRRQTIQIVALGRGEDRRTYRLPRGKSLVGKTLWLRAEETGGPRTLNYRFEVKTP